MRRECPEIAVSTHIDAADRLMERVQDGSLDAAVLYAAPRRPGIIPELLFDEKLVLVSSMHKDRPLPPMDQVQVDWGGDLDSSSTDAFQVQPHAVLAISYGPQALAYKTR